MAVAEKTKTTEERLGIPLPPDHQCPSIDKVIKAIQWVDKYAGKSTRMEEDELRSLLSDIESEMWGLESELETIRTACEGLREWGQSWKELAKSMAKSNDLDLDDYV